MNEQVALQILVEAAQVAQSRGAFKLEEAAQVAQAVGVFIKPKPAPVAPDTEKEVVEKANKKLKKVD